jgi:hypothetical protein
LTHRTEASTHKPYAVVQAFFCHGFCEPTHDSTFIFLKDKKKIKEL